MHFMPEDEGYEEKLWPDGYKAVVKELLPAVISSALQSDETLGHIYQQRFTDEFPDLDRFIDRLTEMLEIGAEKGGDEIFEEIVIAFLYEDRLPEKRAYARYLLMSALPEEITRQIKAQVIEDYRADEVFVHAYRVGYWDLYETYDLFLEETAQLAVAGVLNGIDDMLAGIYKAFATGGPMPPARRNPRRIKNWFVPKGSKKRDIPISRRGRLRRERESDNAENSDMR